jgi:hypothetical protein
VDPLAKLCGALGQGGSLRVTVRLAFRLADEGCSLTLRLANGCGALATGGLLLLFDIIDGAACPHYTDCLVERLAHPSEPSRYTVYQVDPRCSYLKRLA